MPISRRHLKIAKIAQYSQNKGMSATRDKVRAANQQGEEDLNLVGLVLRFHKASVNSSQDKLQVIFKINL